MADLETLDNFYGYYYATYLDGFSFTAYTTCPDDQIFTSTVVSDNTFVGCCHSNRLDCGSYLYTKCDSTSEIRASFATVTCGGTASICTTNYFFRSNSRDAFPMYEVACAESDMLRAEWYRKPKSTFAVTTKASTSSFTSTLARSSTPSTSILPTTTAELIPSTPTPSPTSEKKASKAWIAGVVVGVVALIAIAAIAFWLFRLRKRRAQQTYQANEVSQAYMQQPYVESYAGAPNAASSMLSTQPNTKDASTPSSQNSPQTNSWYQPVATSSSQSTVPVGGSTVDTSLPREMTSTLSLATNDLPELVNKSQTRR